MGVAVTSAASVQTGNGNSQTSLTIAAVTTSGSDRAIVVGHVLRKNGTNPVTGITRSPDTFARQADVGDSDPKTFAELWATTDEPGTSAVDLVVTITTNDDDWMFGYQALSGVDQTTRYDTPNESSSAGGATSTSTSNVSSATDNLVVDVLSLQGSGGTYSADGSQSEDWTESQGTGAGDPQAGASSLTGGASIAMGWSWTSGANYAHLSMDVNAVAAGVTVPDQTYAPAMQLMESGGYIGATIK